MNRKFTAMSIIVLVVLFSTCGFAETQYRFRRVAQTGMAAPVPSQLSVITSFSFNDQGQAAFIADGGLLLKSGSAATVVARVGQAAPGGGRFVSLSGPSLSVNEQLVFRGEVSAPGTSGLFISSHRTISQLLPDGSLGPAGEGLAPIAPAINDAGDVAFLNGASGAIYLLKHGSIVRLAGPGDPVPGGSGDTFLQIKPALSINHGGQVAFASFVASTGGTGVFVASSNAVTRIIAPGDLLPDGSVFAFPSTNPSINDAGQVAVALASSSSQGIYLAANGQLQLVVPQSSPLSDSDFTEVTVSVSLNNAGQIAFTTTTFQGFGVVLFSNGVLTPLALKSGQSPDGDTFNFNAVTLTDAHINNAGQVLFAFSETHQADALYLASNAQVVRFAGNGDPISHRPTLEFPFAFGIAQDSSVLISDFTFPGGTGLYKSTPDSSNDLREDLRDNNSRNADLHNNDLQNNDLPDVDLVLVAHPGQSFGAHNMITALFGSAMNQAGQVAITLDSSATRGTVLLSSSGSISTIADNSTSVNLAGSVLALNNLGDTAFTGFAPASGQFGFFLSSHGQTAELIDGTAQVGDLGTLNDVENPSLNDHDDLAFVARFPGANVIYELSQGNLIRVAADFDPTPDGGQINLPFVNSRVGPIINNHGDIVFVAFDTTNGSTIFLSRKGVLLKVVGPGDAAPDGSSFTFVDAPQMNAAGQIAFFGQTTNSNAAIFVYANGTISEVVHAGSRIGASQISNVDLPFINDGGDIAFTAHLPNGDTAVFVASRRERPTW